MSPEISRSLPSYVQMANHYRERILSGELRPGTRLPSIADLAAQWHVASATAAKAVSLLLVEKVVRTSPRGTFVADEAVAVPGPLERIRAAAIRRDATDELVTVTGTGIVPAPVYVADLLDLDPRTMVIRREEVHSRQDVARGTLWTMLEVCWIPGMQALEAGELLKPSEVEGGVLAFVMRAKGRRRVHGRTHVRAEEADSREAGLLHLPLRAAVLGSADVWSDDDRVLLYSEQVRPMDQVISFELEADLRDLG